MKLLLAMLWMAAAAAAQTPAPTGPAPAGAVAPPQGPAAQTARTNLMSEVLRKRLMALTNQAGRSTNSLALSGLTNPAGAARLPGGAPVAATPTASTKAALPPAAPGASPTNVAEAIIPAPTANPSIRTAPTNTAAASSALAPAAASAAAPTNTGAVTAAAAASTNAATISRPRPFAGLTNRSPVAPGAPVAATASNAPAPAGPGTPAPGAAAPDASRPKPGALVVQPLPGGGTTNIIASGLDPDELLALGQVRFAEAELTQVLDFYSEWTGRTILRPAALPAVKITLRAQTPLTRREAIQALEAVFAMNQITTVPMEDKFVKVIASAQAGQAGGRPVTSPDKIAEFGPFTTHIVQLKYADPKEVMAVIQPFSQTPNSIVAVTTGQILVLRDYAENIKRMLELIEKVDVMVPTQFDPVVIPIKYALASDIQSVLGSLSAGGGGGLTVGSSAGGGRSSGGTLGGGGRSGGFGSTMGSGGLGGQGYQQGYQQGMNPMGTTGGMGTSGAGGSLAGARSSFAQRVGNIVRSASTGAGGGGDIMVIGMAKIIADERTNSLLIFADKQDLGMITNIIAKLDVVLAQVLIEGIVAEVGLNDNFVAGVSMKQRTPSQVGDFTGIGAINPARLSNKAAFTSSGDSNGLAGLAEGFTYVFQLGNDLDVAVAAMAGDSRAQIIQRPRVITSHAKEASIFVGETRPYITGGYYGGGGYGYGGYGGNYSQYQQLQIGINLSILPFINSEGLVVMDIRQRVQGIKGSVQINGNDVPITSDKEATAYIAVRDRDTVLLGGYINSDISKSHAGVPWLKDIPLIGALFKSHKSDSGRTEMVLLVRPTVLNTPEAAATATALERDAMPGIRHAETEYDKQTREEADKLKVEREQQLDQDQKKASKQKKASAGKGF